MRSEKEVIDLIGKVADEDERIRAVVLNGSRANPKVRPDRLRDFDLIFLVNELKSFGKSPDWVNVFGETIIMQIPDNMELDDDIIVNIYDKITYLMLFEDGIRIDLSLVKTEDKDFNQSSLDIILLDKDKLFRGKKEPDDRDYWVKRPSEKKFLDCCNEFWWVSTYVLKGLLRYEIIYARGVLENPLRKMLMRMLSWKVGVDNNFSVSLGNYYKYLNNYIDNSLWERVQMTYPDFDRLRIWYCLKDMMNIFYEMEKEVAGTMNFRYNMTEADKVRNFVFESGSGLEN